MAPSQWRLQVLTLGMTGLLSIPLGIDPVWSQSSPDIPATVATDKEEQLAPMPPFLAEMPEPAAETEPDSAAQELDLSPEILENSPVLRRWLEEIPDIAEDIRHDPSFRTRLRLGYTQFSSTDQAAGWIVGVEDAFVGQTGLTVSGEYQASFNGERESFGADLRYYILPLGGYINVAPVVGYRNLKTGDYEMDGVNVGVRLLLVLSRTGAADVSLTQSFVSPGSSDEVGIATLSVGYAVTENLRLSADIQKQNSREEKDSRVGVVLEWIP